MDILAGCSFNKRVCECLLPANHPSRNIAMNNKTISWKRTKSLANILKNNKLAISNFKNGHGEECAPTGQRNCHIQKTNSLFNHLNSSRASWISWKLCEFGSSGARFEFTAVSSLFLCHFFSLHSEDSKKFQSLSHVPRWPPHMRASEVYSYLPGGYYKIYKPPRRLLSGFTNLWPKYVLKWALGNKNLHKKSKQLYGTHASHIAQGYTRILNFQISKTGQCT